MTSTVRHATETTVLLVDDHPIVRQGLHLLLDGQEDMRIVGEAGDGLTAIELVHELQPDVVIMDITMPGLGGAGATREILAQSPGAKIIALSIHGEKGFIEEMLRAGAAGYILKDSAPEELVAAVRAVMRGEAFLSAAVAGVVVSEYRQVLSSGQAPDDVRDQAAASPTTLTKLYRPPVTPDLEPRTRLLEHLKQNRHRPLTLISAPAGYGKTMLASLWLESCGCPSAWVSLDEMDNDLLTFVSYLLAALQSVCPALDPKVRSLLEAPVQPPAPVLARSLLNDLDQITEPFILALDDVHLMQEQPVLDFLSELLRHPSPSMSLVLIGRRDPPLPIASLRAHRQVTEIRAGDLRFTAQETAQLLGHVLRREIDQATAAEWTERMEGWVTGLLLAALSLRHRAQGDGFHLAVPAHSRYLQEYLLTEVLAHLPPGRRDWLLLASLLDRFCAPLCEAVGQSGQAAGAAGLTGIEFLRWLHEDNLFLVPLDDRSQWFRFHHLFQQLLQDRLQEHLAPQEIAAAHRRASDWLAAEGLVEEALQHALEAGNVQAAVDLVVQQRYDLMNRDQWRQLKRWLDLLPPEAVARDPLLLCAQALWAIHDGAFDVIVSSVQRAQQLVEDLDPGDPPREIAQAEIVVIESLLGLAGPQHAGTLERCRSALGVLPRQALHIRSLAIFSTLLSQQMLGDMQGAVTTSKEALAQQPWPDAYRAKMMHYLCLAHVQEGDWLRVLGAAPTGLKTAEKSLAPEPLNWCRCDLGTAHYLRGEFEQAEPYLLALLEDRYVAPAGYLAQGGFLLALLYLGQDRNTEAAQTIEYLEATFQETKDLPNLALAAAFQVEIALREGRLAQAHALGGSLEFDLIPPHWQFYVPQLTPIKLLLAEKSPASLQEARTLLEVLDEKMQEINRKNVRIDVLALLALVCDAQGDEQAALEKLAAALDLGMVGENVRCFADLGAPMAGLLRRLRQSDRGVSSDARPYVDRVLAAFEPAPKPEQPVTTSAATGSAAPSVFEEAGGLIEPLTRRELEVLALLAQQLTYREIAAELFIAHGTVGQHVVRIYQKLQVNDRREALAKALALGILPQQ